MKLTTLSADRKNNLTIELTLRGGYTVRNEKKLREVLQIAINTKSPAERLSLQSKLNNNEILDILRYFGMIAKTKVLKIESV